MSNDIQVTVTHEDFEQITDINKKLNLMYRVMSAQQTHCKATVERLDDKIDKIERPQINPVKAGGILGGGITVGAILDWFAHYITK